MTVACSYFLLSGIKLEDDVLDLGRGVTLSKTYVHLMAHPILAFAPASNGKPSPAPWRAVKVEEITDATDLVAELKVPHDSSDSTLHLEYASWITLLLRFLTNSVVTITLVSPVDSHGLKDGIADATLAETVPPLIPRALITSAMASWIKDNWYKSIDLSKNDTVLFAVMSLYHSHRASAALGMISVWAALERIFSTKGEELKYRVSTNVAAFIEPAGESRYLLFKRLLKLYDDRSNAAHGTPLKNPNAYEESVAIASRAILRIVETDRVPDKDYLEHEVLAPSTCKADVSDATQPS